MSNTGQRALLRLNLIDNSLHKPRPDSSQSLVCCHLWDRSTRPGSPSAPPAAPLWSSWPRGRGLRPGWPGPPACSRWGRRSRPHHPGLVRSRQDVTIRGHPRVTSEEDVVRSDVTSDQLVIRSSSSDHADHTVIIIMLSSDVTACHSGVPGLVTDWWLSPGSEWRVNTGHTPPAPGASHPSRHTSQPCITSRYTGTSPAAITGRKK